MAQATFAPEYQSNRTYSAFLSLQTFFQMMEGNCAIVPAGKKYDITAGTYYIFKVKACNIVGCGADSSPVSVMAAN